MRGSGCAPECGSATPWSPSAADPPPPERRSCPGTQRRVGLAPALWFLFFFFFNPPLTHLSCQAGTQTTLPGEQASKPSLLALNRTSEAMCSLLSVTIGWWSHCSSKNARLYFPLYRNAAMQLGRTVLCAHAQLSVDGGILDLRRGSQPSPWVGPGKPNLPLGSFYP